MNNLNLLIDCISSIYKKTNYPDFKVIVSDNGSKDGSVDYIKKHFKKVYLIENGKNLGFSSANNKGIKYALEEYNSDYVYLLNNDTKIIQKDWLTEAVKIAENNKKVGIVGSKLVYDDMSLQFVSIGGKNRLFRKGEVMELKGEDKVLSEKESEVPSVMGAGFLVTRKLINKIGMLDQKFDPLYGEEIDYCLRATKNNFKIIYAPKSVVIHIRSQTMDPAKITRDWYITKRHSMRLELLNYNPFRIIYWGFIHFGSVFLGVGDDRRLKFHWDFLKRFFLLFKAFFENIPDIPEIFHKRYHRDEKIWYDKW